MERLVLLNTYGPHQTPPDLHRSAHEIGAFCRLTAGAGSSSTPDLRPGAPRRYRGGQARPGLLGTISDVTTTEETSAPGTLRDIARDAVRRGLEAAVASGALPALPDPAVAAVEVSRPANPEHGDLATNLALRLARPLRMAPPAIAAALVEAIASDPANRDTISRAEAAGPGFVNLTLRRRCRRGRDRCRPARSRRLGPRALGRRHGPPRQRRVRLREPDRAPARRQRPRGVRRRPARARARGRRAAGHARVLLQ